VNRGESNYARIGRAQNAREALELRLQGLTFDQIGARMGFSRQRAHALVTEELARVNGERNEAAAQLRNLEAERLDRLQAAVWPMAMGGDLKAVDRVLAIMARRARLLSLDAQPNFLHPEEAFAFVRGLIAAVRSAVDDPDTLRQISENIRRACGGTIPGISSETPSEIDREIDSTHENRSCETREDGEGVSEENHAEGQTVPVNGCGLTEPGRWPRPVTGVG
jgi:hypothetical protein